MALNARNNPKWYYMAPKDSVRLQKGPMKLKMGSLISKWAYEVINSLMKLKYCNIVDKANKQYNGIMNVKTG